MESRDSPRTFGSIPRALATAAGGLLVLLVLPGTAAAQDVSTEWSCFRSWTVSYMQESEPFTVDSSPWALRWRRTTPTHTEHDGLFAELYRVEEGKKTKDQVAAVNTDHQGHKGTVTISETGTFWLDLESWSERTEWKIEACRPAEGSG